jgi:RNA polymerase sigma-70 factor (ECF subfamily)
MLSQNKDSSVISSVGDAVALKNLIIQAKSGNKEAFGGVYSMLYKPLYRYAFSRSRSKELAEDISQQTFLRFYEALPGYKHETSPLAYLFTIAKRLLINHAEKKTFSSIDEYLIEELPAQDDILEEEHVRILAENINDLLPKLQPDEEEVIRLFFYAELSYKEISAVMDREEVYLRKIKERALKKLRILSRHLL